MKYSEKLVWKAVYELVPNYKIVKENDVSLNLPQCLNHTAITIFLKIGNNAISSLGMNECYAAHIVQDALREINSVGWMTFGTQEDYWGKE